MVVPSAKTDFVSDFQTLNLSFIFFLFFTHLDLVLIRMWCYRYPSRPYRYWPVLKKVQPQSLIILLIVNNNYNFNLYLLMMDFSDGKVYIHIHLCEQFSHFSSSNFSSLFSPPQPEAVLLIHYLHVPVM